MTRFQGASFASLLCLASALGHADTLLVNTTVDEDQVTGGKCSLREAVGYIHQKNIIRKDVVTLQSKVSTKTVQIDNRASDIKLLQSQLTGATGAEKTRLENEIKRLEGETAAFKAELALLNEALKVIDNQVLGLRIFGCTPTAESSSDNDIIYIQTQDPETKAPVGSYKLTRGPILLKDAITIARDASADGIDINPDQLRPEIQADGAFQTFIIDDGAIDQKRRITVVLRNLILTGCDNTATATVCATNGGVVSSRESLELDYTTVRNGFASQSGGGIYVYDHGTLKAIDSILSHNKALEGAAVFSTAPGVQIRTSLISENTVTTAGKAALEIASDTFPDGMILNGGGMVVSSTFSANHAVAIRVPDTIPLRNLTVVNNEGGVDFDGKDTKLINSIVAGNGEDCIGEPVLTKFRYNLFSDGCPIGATADGNRKLGNTPEETLIAAKDVNGNCAAPPAVGLLCPLSTGAYGKAPFHLPRMLAGYSAETDSPIINKGTPPSDTGTAEEWGCQATDQRGIAVSLCDIGAVELISLNAETQGQDAVSGDTVRFSMVEKIGDGELLPAAFCPPGAGNPAYHPEIDGCPTLVKMPNKGTLSFDNAKHEIIYTPDSAYHGRDNFQYSLMTTLSRFSNAVNNRTLTMTVTVVSEPTGELPSKTFAGGSFGIPGLLGLAGLVFLRRRNTRG